MLLEASTGPATVPGWWRRWPAWSAHAALAWSALYGALALSWAAGAPGFPFGERDPEGAAMGSVLFSAPAAPTGLIMAACCAVGAIATIAYHHRRHHRGSVAAGPRLGQEASC